jgi:hypothetical protein
VQRCTLLVQVGLSTLARGLLLGDPGTALGELGALLARLGVLTMLRRHPLAAALELTLLGAHAAARASTGHDDREQNHDEYRDHNDRDDRSC